MSIFRKNPDVIFDDAGGKTPVKFRRKSRLSRPTEPGNRADDVTKKAKRKKIRRIVIWTLVVLILGLLGFFGYRAYKSLNSTFTNGSGDILSLFNGNALKPLKGESRGRTNVLLLGTGDAGHDGEGLTDTIILMSYDYKTGSIAMFSIPRDTYVKIPGNGYSKINAANVYGENKQKGSGISTVEQTVTQALNQPIDYYVMVNFSGLKQAVDAVGGITVNVENSFCDYNYPTEYKGDTRTVCFTAGPQTMNGIKALQYSRSRHSLQNGEGSDFARSKRQQRVLIGLKEKLLSGTTTYNPATYLKLIDVLGSNMKTDFQVAEFARLFDLAKKVDQTKIIQKSFDSSAEGMLTASSGAAGYILQPTTGNWKAIQAVVANIFSTAGVKQEAAKVAVQNGTWTTGLALTASSDLKAAGYDVVSSGDAATKNYKKTVILDYSAGKKPKTIAALEKKYGVISSKATVAEGQTAPTYDVLVIVGSDYAARQ